jgi:hypothetical protein
VYHAAGFSNPEGPLLADLHDRTIKLLLQILIDTFQRMVKKHFSGIQLYRLFETGETENPLDEICTLTAEISPTIDIDFLQKVHADIGLFFKGDYPGFDASVSRYHDLRHTHSVALATARLFHGMHYDNNCLPSDIILQGLLSAYFHDLGMLPRTPGSDKYYDSSTRDHESRSMDIVKQYLDTNNYPATFSDNCTTLIKYTNLDWNVSSVAKHNSEVHICGQVVGSADLLAQMSDRYYVESLPHLFQEHLDSGIEQHDSAVDLMRSTIEFHEKIIKTRLWKSLGNLSPSMQTHFRHRFGIDRNLYIENIELNLTYLERITQDCGMELKCWEKYLRRMPPEAEQ